MFLFVLWSVSDTTALLATAGTCHGVFGIMHSVVTDTCQLAAAPHPSSDCISAAFMHVKHSGIPWEEGRQWIFEIFSYTSGAQRIAIENNSSTCITNGRNFQTHAYADCNLLGEKFLPQITKVHFATHTSVTSHCISRHFPQKLCGPWIWAYKVPPASCVISLSQPLWNLFGGSGYLARVGRRSGKGLSCIPITSSSWIMPTMP